MARIKVNVLLSVLLSYVVLAYNGINVSPDIVLLLQNIPLLKLPWSNSLE